MLEPVLCGHISVAPLLPKLRGHFAEFLNNASSVGLGLLDLSTCVGLRYGCGANDSGFSRHHLMTLPYLISVVSTCPFIPRFFLRLFSMSFPGLSAPGRPLVMCPHSSVASQYRNLNLLSIAYASRPQLRSRLTQGRSALPWKPRIFGLGDSRPHLATHSGILSSHASTTPFGIASLTWQCSPTDHISDPKASATCFSPGHFRRRTSRLVSYYALFEWMAASEPTS